MFRGKIFAVPEVFDDPRPGGSAAPSGDVNQYAASPPNITSSKGLLDPAISFNKDNRYVGKTFCLSKTAAIDAKSAI